MTRKDVQKKWEARITAFRCSGEKATRWCKANQVDRRQLYAWMKRLGGAPATSSVAKPTSFIPVELAPEEPK